MSETKIEQIDILEDGALPRRVMTLFMLIDTSGSMTIDGNIDKVNRAVEETIQQLRDISDSNFDAEIRIAIMEFSNTPRWVTPNAMALDDVVWNDLTANGLTNMGAAFVELESKLSRSQFLQSSTGAYAPVLILLSDGAAVDSIDHGLDLLRHNNWYRVATKVAIAVDNSALDVLAQFTGNSETVIRYDSNKSDLQTLLTRLAVVSSKMQSRSKNAGDLGIAADSDGATDSDSAAAIQSAVDVVAQIQQESGSGSNGGNVKWESGW